MGKTKARERTQARDEAGPSKKQKFAGDRNELSPADLAIVEELTAPLEAHILNTLHSMLQRSTRSQIQLPQLASALAKGCKDMVMHGARESAIPEEQRCGQSAESIASLEAALPASLPFSRDDKECIIGMLMSMVHNLVDGFLYSKKPYRNATGQVVTWQHLMEEQEKAEEANKENLDKVLRNFAEKKALQSAGGSSEGSRI